MATVREIQVDGGKVVQTLEEACIEYLARLEETDRKKLHFCIILASGKIRGITVRQEGDRVIAYGDFEGLPNALEEAQDKERK